MKEQNLSNRKIAGISNIDGKKENLKYKQEKLENGYMVQNTFKYSEYLKSSSSEKDMARIPLVKSYIEKTNKL